MSTLFLKPGVCSFLLHANCKKVKRLALTIIVLFTTCFSGVVFGQQDGIPPFGVADAHDVDTINLATLVPVLNLHVLSKPGTAPFSYTMTSAQACYLLGFGPGTTLACDKSTRFSGFSAGLGGSLLYTSVTNVLCGGHQIPQYSGWVFVTSDGLDAHPIDPNVVLDGNCATSFNQYTLDGSGYYIQANGGQYPNFTAIGPNGHTITGSSSPAGSASSNTDPFGNTISVSGSQPFVYTDAMGLSILTATTESDVSNAPQYVQWTDTNGNTQQISLTFGPQLTFSFSGSGCPVVKEEANIYPISKVNFPDGTYIGITMETGANGVGTTTGRIASFTTRSGGTVSYVYPPVCTGLAGAPINGTLTRTTEDGTTTYTASTNLSTTTTTVLDAGNNKTVYYISQYKFLTGRDVYQNIGTVGSPVYQLISSDTTCYNGNQTNCRTAGVVYPISQRDTYHTIGAMSTSSRISEAFDTTYGNRTSVSHYDFGATSFTTKTTTSYGSWNGSSCVSVGNNINNLPCDVLTQGISGGNTYTIGESRYSYSSKGSLLTKYDWNGSSWLSNNTTNVYNTNGTPSVTYDLANNSTTYQYDSSKYASCTGTPAGTCNNFPFPTSTTKAGLTTYSTWNGIGAVKLSDIDANGNTTSYCYTTGTDCSGGTYDPFWRPLSVTDPLGNVAYKVYPSGSSPTAVNGTFTFNSGNSILNTTGTVDDYGRTTNTQKQQSPSATQYDTTSTQYSWSGGYREIQSTMPCSTTSGSQCSFSSATTTRLIDPLGRASTVTDGGGGIITKTYTQNDVLTVLSPAPSGESNKQFQREYDGLERLTKTCAIGNGSTTACGQNTGTAKGVTTSYAYTYAAGSSTTTSTRGSQTRTTTVDAMGRVKQKITPEGGAWLSTYDATLGSATCKWSSTPNLAGRLSLVSDPNNNQICYSYDSLGRNTLVNADNTTCRHFYYDNSKGYSGSIPSGVSTPTNSLGRMVEAATDSCSSGTLITDEWFSYDKDGRMSDMWELTPHSGQYYHSVATFFENGKVKTLQLASPSLYTMTYGLDGEGRWNTLTDTTTSTNLVTGATYYPAANPAVVSLTGTTPDNDSYTYDANTGRMTKFVFTVGNTPKNMTGNLTWNANGTLKQLAITDGFNPGGTQTCNFNATAAAGTGYDDCGRLVGVDCGSGQWGQTFSYDIYDNLSKDVISGRIGTEWLPGYSASNNHCNGCTYDADGDVTGDGNNVYGWNEFAKLASTVTSGTPTCGSSGRCAVYDAFGRMVEQTIGSTFRERWITQLGETVYMTGTSPIYAYWPAPGGGKVLLYGNSSSYDFLHSDWLGNARIDSGLTNHTVATDQAYSPYGELYDIFGSNVAQNEGFAGMTGDFAPGTTTPVMWDTPNRELSMVGRWLSPDPAGAGWNQYAYATNPNSSVDPSGLFFISCPGGFNGCRDVNEAFDSNIQVADYYDYTNMDIDLAIAQAAAADQGNTYNGTCANVPGDCSSSRTLPPNYYLEGTDYLQSLVNDIYNFNQIAAGQTNQIIQNYEYGEDTPSQLQGLLALYEDPPFGFNDASAWGAINSWVSDQLRSTLQSDVDYTVSVATPEQLQQFSGMITQAGISNAPTAIDNAVGTVANYAWGKAIGWAAGEFSSAVNNVLGFLIPPSPTQTLVNYAQGAVNHQLNSNP